MNQMFEPLLESLSVTWTQIQLFLPRALGALLLLTLGWLVAQLVRRVLVRVLHALRVDVVSERIGLEDFLLRGGVRFTAVTLIAQVVYWGLFLVVALSTFNVLGVPVPASTIEHVAGYVPNVLVALLIAIFGSLLAQFARAAILTYLNNVGLQGAHVFATIAHGAILAFVAALALGQLNIGGALLHSAFQLAFGGLCLALALAFGLGGRDWAARVLDGLGKGR